MHKLSCLGESQHTQRIKIIFHRGFSASHRSNANAMTFQVQPPVCWEKQHFAVQLGNTQFDTIFGFGH